VEQRIASEKAAIDAAKGEVRELESKKKILETEIGSAETQRGKYQTQQLSVKKNDEYQALGHEIQNVQKQIDELEGPRAGGDVRDRRGEEAVRRRRGDAQAEHRRATRPG
jgi:predicted  nucleic acid-binding Zn-ribbon protein